MAYYFIQLNSELRRLQEQRADLQTKLKTYQATIRKINELEKKIKEIRAKLAVIKQLEKNKTGPVHLLDEIAMAIPKEKLWLTSLQESAGTLKLSGTAMDNETVALFMTNLERSDYVGSVNLQSARLRYMPAYKLRVSDFVLDCKTYAYKQKTRAN
jgi:type IV pilus assembly protein PilN